MPSVDGKVAWADVRDIVAVNAEVLLNPKKYRNQTLTITGSEALSYSEAVAALNHVLGKDTKYVAVSDKDVIDAMTGMKFPEFFIDFMISET